HRSSRQTSPRPAALRPADVCLAPARRDRRRRHSCAARSSQNDASPLRAALPFRNRRKRWWPMRARKKETSMSDPKSEMKLEFALDAARLALQAAAEVAHELKPADP